ncbi:MAG: hypothetical protein R6U98_18890 [Pirellulaceae bacterium]
MRGAALVGILALRPHLAAVAGGGEEEGPMLSVRWRRSAEYLLPGIAE